MSVAAVVDVADGAGLAGVASVASAVSSTDGVSADAGRDHVLFRVVLFCVARRIAALHHFRDLVTSPPH